MMSEKNRNRNAVICLRRCFWLNAVKAGLGLAVILSFIGKPCYALSLKEEGKEEGGEKIVIENSYYQVSLSSTGGAIKSLILKKTGTNLTETTGIGNDITVKQGHPGAWNLVYSCRIVEKTKNRIAIRYSGRQRGDFAEGIVIKKTYIFKENVPFIEVKVRIINKGIPRIYGYRVHNMVKLGLKTEGDIYFCPRKYGMKKIKAGPKTRDTFIKDLTTGWAGAIDKERGDGILYKPVPESTEKFHMWFGENASTIEWWYKDIELEKGNVFETTYLIFPITGIKSVSEALSKAEKDTEGIKTASKLTKGILSIVLQEEFEEKQAIWGNTINKLEARIQSLPVSSSFDKYGKERAKDRLRSLKKKVRKVSPVFLEQRETDIDFSISQLDSLLAALETGKIRSKDCIIYVVKPITNERILPKTASVPGEISDTLFITAAPGEYEPASFVVSAFSDINSLEVKASDLKGEKGSIPFSNVDIKIVKCWYQAGTAWFGIGQRKNKRVLVPELLLNDDSLIKVDYKEEKNYLKLNFPEGEKYLWISDKGEKTDALGHFKLLSVKDYPVKDASTLLPIDIPAETNQQYWVTVKVPDTVKEGVYTGSITLSAGKETIAKLSLMLKVLPFKLASPKTYYDLREDFVSSLYYRGKLDPNYPKGTISSEYKSKEQLKAELKNMFIHGVTNPTVYQGFSNKELLGKYLQIRKEVGMSGETLYYYGVLTGRHTAPAALEALRNRVRKAIEFVKPYGIQELYVYGIDEAKGERLQSQRLAWEAVHEAGGKVFVGGYKNSNFPAMGDIQDLLNCCGSLSKEEAKKWHSVGHKIFSAANPQAGVENPEIYRRNYGLLLWKANYDGASTYAYQHSMGNIWNDFDHSGYRDHNFVYPTLNGVIDTIAWEGYREGMDDIRYAVTLRLEIEKAKKSGNRKIRETALSAEKYLEDIDIGRADLYAVRSEIIDYILKLTEGRL